MSVTSKPLPNDRDLLLRMLDEVVEYLRLSRSNVPSYEVWIEGWYKLVYTADYLDIPPRGGLGDWLKKKSLTTRDGVKLVNGEVDALRSAILEKLDKVGSIPSPPSRKNTPESQEKTSTPLEQTLELLSRGFNASKLICYLNAEPKKTRKLREVSEHIYNGDQTKPTLAKTSKLIRRTLKRLEGKEAPMRIAWDPDKGKVTLLETS
jgi:hypothetical protein